MRKLSPQPGRFHRLGVLLAVALCVSATLAACGGSQTWPVVSSPFTERDEKLFDNGVDLMLDPDALQGHWREDWEHELSDRLLRSDVVLEGEVLSVHVDTDPDQRQSYRVVMSVFKVHRGKLAPGMQEISLMTREGALGYSSVAGNPNRILRKTFFAFLKFAETPSAPVANFHLTPPSLPLRRGLANAPKEKR